MLLSITQLLSMEGGNEVFCPKCKGPPKATYVAGGAFSTHICYQNCGYIFWTLNVCPFCQDPSKTLILKKPNFGQKITCTNCRSTMYYFRCPQLDCGRLFFKTQKAYKMGEVNTCQQCNYSYKTLACPCGGEVKIDKNQVIYEGHSSFTCQCCKKTLIYTICPSCTEPEYHIDPLTIGERIRCSSCKTWRKYVPCPQCGHTLSTPSFSFYQPMKCNHCEIVFQYCKCPYSCSSVSFNYLTKEQGPQRQCYECKKSYSVINCKRCEMSLYHERLLTPSKEATVDLCLNCKKQIKYYYCPCGIFNYDVQCRNPMCARPQKITDMIKQKEEEQKKKQNKNKNQNQNQDPNFEQKQCKICFEKESEVINEMCGHIAMCRGCLNNFSKGRVEGAFPCPICRTIGKYFKYKEPIYS